MYVDMILSGIIDTAFWATVVFIGTTASLYVMSFIEHCIDYDHDYYWFITAVVSVMALFIILHYTR